MGKKAKGEMKKLGCKAHLKETRKLGRVRASVGRKVELKF